MHRSTTTLRLVALVAALLLGASATACGSDDGDDETATTEAPATTEAAADEGDDEASEEEGDEGEADAPTRAEATGEVETTGLLEFLQAEDAAIGDLFDWNTQAGVIAINYVGTQTVQLYHYGELDADTAVAACELASEHVFPIDEAAAIEVRSGQYPDGAVVASVSGADGTCAAA